jgi:diguanylate cyclase (GGDEF)-like protein/PAS domain S-box-containing protein
MTSDVPDKSQRSGAQSELEPRSQEQHDGDQRRWRRYRTAIESASDGYFELSLAGQIVDVNDAFCGLFGYAREEIIGRSPMDLADASSHDVLTEQLAKIATTEHRRVQLIGRRKDGSTFPILVRAVTYRDAAEQPAGSLGFITDLSCAIAAEQSIARSERELRGIVENLQDTYYRTDLEGRIVRLDGSVAVHSGYTREEVIGRKMADFYCNPEDRQQFLAALHAGGGVVRHYEGRMRHKEGKEWWASTNARYYYDEHGQVAGVEGISRDITDLRIAREGLRLAAQVFSAASEAILITDAQLRVLKVNPAFEDVAGLSADKAVGRSLLDFALIDDEDSAVDEFRSALGARGLWSGEVWSRRRDGSGYPCWLSVSSVHAENGQVTHFIAMLSDITERKATQARIEFLAHHDPLTLLPNRLLLRDRVEQAIGRANRMGGLIALLFVDLDEFKEVNDRYGHQAGDAVLREIGQRLAASVRNTDTVCRLGGDEFVIALTDLTTFEIVAEVAEKIRSEVMQPIALPAGIVKIGCSIGTSLYPRDGNDYEVLLASADAAMYAAKRRERTGHPRAGATPYRPSAPRTDPTFESEPEPVRS